jgi:phosphoglycolate phosphatase
MDLKMPKGVLFDLDGTLLDSAPDFVASLNNLLTKHNKPKLDPEIIRSHVSDGAGNSQAWVLILIYLMISVQF